MKNHKLLVCLLAVSPSLSLAQGSLENPVAGSTESGIGAISGWHCTAKNIEVTIDGMSLGKAGSGTGRGDTTSICGRTDTGYSLLFNYNDLTPGSHSISAFGDGQLLETKQFNTIQSGGSAFVTGISKTATIANFPSTGRTATLQWSQAKQNFVITGISDPSVSVPIQVTADAAGRAKVLLLSGKRTFYAADKKSILAEYTIFDTIVPILPNSWSVMGENLHPYSGFPSSLNGKNVIATYDPNSKYKIVDYLSAEPNSFWEFAFDSIGPEVTGCLYRYKPFSELTVGKGLCTPFWANLE